MNNLGSVLENLEVEKRICITPETLKKLTALGFNVSLEKNYGKHLGITDDSYKALGAKFYEANEVFKQSNIIFRMNCPSEEEINLINKNSILIGNFNPSSNKSIINKLLNKQIKIFSLDLLPRVTRAQSMDILSSQANLAGYQAVIESIYEYGKVVPMMMTAAGTITPAKILVIGVGVAGLQAIATAKRLGGVVSATDVRSVAKEQVESLGAKFLSVENSENLETKDGYAKEAGEDFKKKQSELLKKTVVNQDIIICTALIPGKKAPQIISEEMIKTMKPGAVIYDLAVEQGGNCAFSESNKTNIINGVKILGLKNILNKLPLSASSLYAKNLLSFLQNLYNKETKQLLINQEDEIIKKTLISKELN